MISSDILADAGQYFYECENFKTIFHPTAGDCSVYYSFGSLPYLPIQEGGGKSCNSGYC